MRVKALAVLSIVLMLTAGIMTISDSDADAAQSDFLIYYGNGSTKWIGTHLSPTISSTVINSLTDAGITITISGSTITIDGLTSRSTGAADTGGTVSVPGTTGNTVNCHWNIYSWSNNLLRWTVVDPSDYDSTYSMHKLAVGFYPDGMTPTVNPNYKTAVEDLVRTVLDRLTE